LGIQSRSIQLRRAMYAVDELYCSIDVVVGEKEK
jgi:hypothetical protein